MNADEHARVLIFKVFHYLHYLHYLQINLLNCRELITTKLLAQTFTVIFFNKSFENNKKFIQSHLHKKASFKI